MKARIWFWTHSLIGVTAGLMLFIIAWSGAMAVFSREIDWVFNPAIRAEAAPVASWENIRAAVEARFPDAKIRTLSAPWAPGFAADVEIDTPAQDGIHVYVGPAAARVQGSTSYFNIQRFFRSFHMELFWGIDRWGYYVVGVFSLVLLASAITALVFYKRWWRGFFGLEFRHGLRVSVSDLHKTLGVWSLAFIVVIAATGFWYLLKRMDGVFIALPHAEQHLAEFTRLAKGGSERALTLDELVTRAHQVHPRLDITAIYPSAKATDPVRIEGFAGDFLAGEQANSVTLSPTNGQILAVGRARDLSPYFRWVQAVDLLHTGRWGGLPARIAWFVFGTALASMSLTGAFLHVKKQARHDRRLPRAAVLIGYFCVIAALIVSIRGAIAEIHAYGPYIGDSDVQTFPQVNVGVISFLTAWALTLVAPILLWARWVR